MGIVGKQSINGTAHLLASTAYGTCNTEANTAAKVVMLPDYDLSTPITGMEIRIKFTNSNTATNPTININSTGAKSIMRYGTTAVGTTVTTSWRAGSIVGFTYDGTNWVMNDFTEDTDTTYSNVAASNGGTSAGLCTSGEKYIWNNKQNAVSSVSVTITPANWNSTTTCDKTVTGVTASNNIVVSPVPASMSDYVSTGVYCSGQSSNTLTFTCSTTPTASITVNVLIID